MAKGSGTTRTTSTNNYAKTTKTPIAVNTNGGKLTKGQIKIMLQSDESISSLPHRDVVRQLQQGISRYESVMGVRERTIRVADIPGAYGATYFNSDGSQGVYLNKSLFSKPLKQFEADYRRDNYDTGFKNQTNRPIQHTITHELAHASWTSGYSGDKHKAAGKEIRHLYKEWMKDKSKKGYGSYGASNVDEFWAEVVTKGIHGRSDRYTRRAIEIAHRFKL